MAAMDEPATQPHHAPTGDRHRQRASHLYGLIVSGAVLATAPEDFRLVRVAVLLFGTLVIYWAAETYVHWIATRTLVQRDLTRHEFRLIVGDGWPLVAACSVPVAFLLLEALLGIDTATALDVTLVVNVGLLIATGWQMGRASGLAGVQLFVSVCVTGLLGISLIVLKTLLH
jgi:hypothetical protein